MKKRWFAHLLDEEPETKLTTPSVEQPVPVGTNEIYVVNVLPPATAFKSPRKTGQYQSDLRTPLLECKVSP